uniref:Uncharacterized protein n=1 Tax=Opuntia streptacantha TaxID=393608 RepID=A0A7C8ZBF0_OPUST
MDGRQCLQLCYLDTLVRGAKPMQGCRHICEFHSLSKQKRFCNMPKPNGARTTHWDKNKHQKDDLRCIRRITQEPQITSSQTSFNGTRGILHRWNPMEPAQRSSDHVLQHKAQRQP